MKLTPAHWMIVAGQLATFAMLIGGLEHGWRDAITPGFVAAVIMQLATLIAALANESIRGRKVWTPEERTAARE